MAILSAASRRNQASSNNGAKKAGVARMRRTALLPLSPASFNTLRESR